jgi:hypothetical protein
MFLSFFFFSFSEHRLRRQRTSDTVIMACRKAQHRYAQAYFYVRKKDNPVTQMKVKTNSNEMNFLPHQKKVAYFRAQIPSQICFS